MSRGQLGGDGEADSAAGSPRGRLAAPEPVEDVRQLIGRNADAGVGDREHRPLTVAPGAHRDPAARRGELERVAEQVGHHLVHPPLIDDDRRLGQLAVERDRGGLEPAAQAVGRRQRDVGQIARLARQMQHGRVRRRHRLQVVDHAGQPQHLIAERPQFLRGGLGDAVEQGLVSRLEDRHRRAELVRDARHQVPADLVLAVERVGHLIERGGEFAQFARPAHLPRPGRPVAACHRPGHRDQPGDGAGDAPGDSEPGDEREQRGEPGGPRDGSQQRRPQDVIGAAETGRGEADEDGADLAPIDHHGHARLGFVGRREAVGAGDRVTRVIAQLQLHATALGQVADGREVGAGPAPVGVPRAGRRYREGACQLVALPVGELGHVDGGEHRGEHREQGDRRQRDAEERQRQPQPERAAALRRRRLSHRGSGQAGSRRRARSRSPGGRPDPPRSCGGGSSRASRPCARSRRTRSPAPC